MEYYFSEEDLTFLFKKYKSLCKDGVITKEIFDKAIKKVLCEIYKVPIVEADQKSVIEICKDIPKMDCSIIEKVARKGLCGTIEIGDFVNKLGVKNEHDIIDAYFISNFDNFEDFVFEYCRTGNVYSKNGTFYKASIGPFGSAIIEEIKE